MNASLAVVPYYQESSRPDIAWIKKNVPVLEIGKALGLRIRHRRTRCWRPENHIHGDADPSLHFFERGNRVRCFVCDMRGGHSNIDLVMGVLSIAFGEAVGWIAERFAVPNVKPGRPVRSQTADSVLPYRVGVNGSEFEVVVRSGMFGQLPAAARSILVVLAMFRDPDSGLTRMSYKAIERYAGVGSSATVSGSLKTLARLHAIEIHPGARVGVTRVCGAYRVTLDDPKFYDSCNSIFQRARAEICSEREYRAQLRRTRQRLNPRKVTEAGGYAPPDPAFSFSSFKAEEKPPTCEGLNLSSVDEVLSSKTLQSVKRETHFSGRRSIEEQKQILRERGLL